MKGNYKPIKELWREEVRKDKDLFDFLRHFFSSDNETQIFINRCVKKLKIRRMLLRLQWYIQIADDIELIKLHRPSLQIIFLMSAAEGVIKTVFNKPKSEQSIKEFFSFISEADKMLIIKKFRRPFSFKYHRLRFSSIIKIFYEIRNRAVHGEDYWGFSFLNDADKESGFWQLTSGYLGKKIKRNETFELKLTYKEFRNIVAKTGLRCIQATLVR